MQVAYRRLILMTLRRGSLIELLRTANLAIGDAGRAPRGLEIIAWERRLRWVLANDVRIGGCRPPF